MLGNIKSIHILKIIFSHLIKALKLEIPKYNKSLQNKINLSINNYKEFTKRYIIYSSKESGKEYNENNELIYEGNFLNGKRNGIGKEYNDNGALIFEGEYLKGKRWNGKVFFGDKSYQLKNGKGYIKEYINIELLEMKLIFEGEYLNGKRNGKGKEYKENGKLIFEGEYVNGKRNGKGKEYNEMVY